MRKIASLRGIAQPGSASALGAESREFESLYPDKEFPHTFECGVLRKNCPGMVSVAIRARSSSG